jgi:hypothetical protein
MGIAGVGGEDEDEVGGWMDRRMGRRGSAAHPWVDAKRVGATVWERTCRCSAIRAGRRVVCAVVASILDLD